MRIITFILLLLPFVSNSQSRLDSLILNKINFHRSCKGLDNIEFSPQGICVSENHAKYMAISGWVSHEQIWEIPDFEIEPDFGKRNWRCGIDTLNSGTIYTELVFCEIDSLGFSDEELSTFVVDGWINSEDNGPILLVPELKFCGISSKWGPKVIGFYEDLETGDFTRIEWSSNYLFVSLNAYNISIVE